MVGGIKCGDPVETAPGWTEARVNVLLESFGLGSHGGPNSSEFLTHNSLKWIPGRLGTWTVGSHVPSASSESFLPDAHTGISTMTVW